MTSYERYAKIRDSKGLTDYKVAKAINTGTATFTNWKQGKYTPKADKIEAIAKVLDVSPDDIVEKKRFKIKVPRMADVAPEMSDRIESDYSDIIRSITDTTLKELNIDPEAIVFSRLFSKLNQEGKVKLYGYLQDLLLIGKYVKPENQEQENDTESTDAERAYEKAFGIQSEQEDPVLNTTEGTEKIG